MTTILVFGRRLRISGSAPPINKLLNTMASGLISWFNQSTNRRTSSAWLPWMPFNIDTDNSPSLDASVDAARLVAQRISGGQSSGRRNTAGT